MWQFLFSSISRICIAISILSTDPRLDSANHLSVCTKQSFYSNCTEGILCQLCMRVKIKCSLGQKVVWKWAVSIFPTDLRCPFCVFTYQTVHTACTEGCHNRTTRRVHCGYSRYQLNWNGRVMSSRCVQFWSGRCFKSFYSLREQQGLLKEQKQPNSRIIEFLLTDPTMYTSDSITIELLLLFSQETQLLAGWLPQYDDPADNIRIFPKVNVVITMEYSNIYESECDDYQGIFVEYLPK